MATYNLGWHYSWDGKFEQGYPYLQSVWC
jgi:hypothetical protein